LSKRLLAEAEITKTPSFTPVRFNVLQRTPAGHRELSTLPPIVHQVLGSPGRPLDPATRASVEPRLGHDFGRVRVHADARAGESARAVGARAYTVGRDVVFAPGQYAPGTDRGQRLLEHELAHVAQQGMGGAFAPTGASYRQAEREAARVSAASVGGASARISSGVRPGVLQAQDEEEQPWYEEAGEWVLGAIGGEFIDEPTFGQIGADFVLSVIPVVDQVADARDLAAHVYRLGIRGEHTRWDRWVALVFSLIGLVPEVGSVIKSLSRAALRGVNLVLENIGEIMALARRVIPIELPDVGALHRYVADNWSRFAEFGASVWDRLLTRGDELAAMIPRIAAGARRAVLDRFATLRRVSLEVLPRALENAKNTILDVLNRVKERLGFGRRAPTLEPAGPKLPPRKTPEPDPRRRGPGRRSLGRQEMVDLLQGVWRDNPILARVARAQDMPPAAQSAELMGILRDFQRQTGIPLDITPQLGVQRTRGAGNLASMRSKPGRLQIEQQVFDDPATLMGEVRHELAYHFAGGPGGVPRLGETPFSALELLEMMIQGRGKLPPPLLP
jgi:hypothetical protein